MGVGRITEMEKSVSETSKNVSAIYMDFEG